MMKRYMGRRRSDTGSAALSLLVIVVMIVLGLLAAWKVFGRSQVNAVAWAGQRVESLAGDHGSSTSSAGWAGPQVESLAGDHGSSTSSAGPSSAALDLTRVEPSSPVPVESSPGAVVQATAPTFEWPAEQTGLLDGTVRDVSFMAGLVRNAAVDVWETAKLLKNGVPALLDAENWDRARECVMGGPCTDPEVISRVVRGVWNAGREAYNRETAIVDSGSAWESGQARANLAWVPLSLFLPGGKVNRGRRAVSAGIRHAEDVAAVAGRYADEAAGAARAARLARMSQPRRKLEALLDRPLDPHRREILERRWEGIDQDVARIGRARDRTSARSRRGGDLSDLEDDLAIRRGNTSSTVHAAGEGASIARRNFEAAEGLVDEWVGAGDGLTVERINQLNRTLRRGIPSEGPGGGVLRTAGHEVGTSGGGSYLPGVDVSDAMDDFVDVLARDAHLHPVEQAGRAYQRVVSIHPYSDGNGRTGRAVADWILRRNGYPPANLDLGTDHHAALFIRNAAHQPPHQVLDAMTDAIARSRGEYLGALGRTRLPIRRPSRAPSGPWTEMN